MAAQQILFDPDVPTRAGRPAPLRLAIVKELDLLEDQHQEKIFHTAFLNFDYEPRLKGLYHPPNGGKRDPNTARALQRRGVKPGVPDIQLDVPKFDSEGNPIYFGLRLELKRTREGDISPDQEARLTQLAKDGYRAIVCWGWIAAWDEILWYLDREDLLVPSYHVATVIVEAYPEFPFWQRKIPKPSKPKTQKR